MTDVTVDLAGLAGFELNLRDMGAGFVSNAARYLPVTALPAGARSKCRRKSSSTRVLPSTDSATTCGGRKAMPRPVDDSPPTRN